ncbi:DapH/DapD/GlmU-related protein [Streptococcus pneumoniae]
MDSRISRKDKMIIYMMAGVKALRGIYIKIFLKKSTGILFVGKDVSLTHASHISCGKNVKFEDYSEIHGLCSDGLIFSDNVTIGRGTKIRPSSYYGVDLGSGLIIGENSSIGPEGYVGCSGKIIIGKNVMFGPKCSLFAENHNFSESEKSIKEQGVSQQGIIVEDNCWIGSNCIILDGVTIGSGSVIGAGTLVSRDVPRNSLIIDKRNKKEKQRILNV